MAKTETYDSFQDLASDQFETIEDEYNHYKARLHHLEGGGIIYEINKCRSKLGRLKPHLKNERVALKGKLISQRGRVDVMEDCLFELREIKDLLKRGLPNPLDSPE